MCRRGMCGGHHLEDGAAGGLGVALGTGQHGLGMSRVGGAGVDELPPRVALAASSRVQEQVDLARVATHARVRRHLFAEAAADQGATVEVVVGDRDLGRRGEHARARRRARPLGLERGETQPEQPRLRRQPDEGLERLVCALGPHLQPQPAYDEGEADQVERHVPEERVVRGEQRLRLAWQQGPRCRGFSGRSPCGQRELRRQAVQHPGWARAGRVLDHLQVAQRPPKHYAEAEIERCPRLVPSNRRCLRLDSRDALAIGRVHWQREHRGARVHVHVAADEAVRANPLALEELLHILGGAQLGSGKGRDRMVPKELLPVPQPSGSENAGQRSTSGRQCLERRAF
mmetsp:Transcript_11493/g.28691  ORF Transcript_11493/g.28691 Transcript_11493/m.28691 type:complete len:344 (+) Transcript_11493:83-1114(+)